MTDYYRPAQDGCQLKGTCRCYPMMCDKCERNGIGPSWKQIQPKWICRKEDFKN